MDASRAEVKIKEILQMNEERASAFTAESKKFALPQIITILKSLTNI